MVIQRTGIWALAACVSFVLSVGCGFGTAGTQEIIGDLTKATGTGTGAAGGGGASSFKVNSMLPADGSKGVSVNTNIDLAFSDFVNISTVGGSTVLLWSSGQPVSISRRLLGDGKTVRLTPTFPLKSSAVYQVSVTTAVTTMSGTALNGGFSAGFTTVGSSGAQDSTAPTVVGSSPSNGASSVPTNATLSIIFSEALQPTSVTSTSFTVTDKTLGSAVTGTLSLSSGDSVANFVPSGGFTASTTYDVAVTTAVTDVAGNALASSYAMSFTTGAGASSDTLGPICDATADPATGPTPANGATGVSVDTTVLLTFNEPISPATISASSFSVRDSSGTSVSGTYDYPTPPGDNSVARFTPDASLTPNTTYDILLANTVTDPSGNAVQNAPKQFQFTTAADGGSQTGFRVTTVVPANMATGVGLQDSVVFTFSGAVNASTAVATTAQNPGSVELTEKASGAVVEGTLSWDPSGTVLTFSPNAQFQPQTTYLTKVTIAVQDQSGAPLAAEFTSEFTTGDGTTQPPTGFAVLSTSPANGAVDWMQFDPIRIDFTEPVDITRQADGSGGFINSFDTTFIQVVAQGDTKACSGTAVFFNGYKSCIWVPEIPGASNGVVDPNRTYITQGKTYTLTIRKETKTSNVNITPLDLQNDFTMTFSTVPAGFMPVRSNPFPGRTNVGVNTGIEIEFSQGMDMPNSNGGWPIELRPVGGALDVGGAINYISPTVRGDGRTATPNDAIIAVYLPGSSLSPNTTYEVKLKTSIVCAAPYTFQGTPATPTPPVTDAAGSPLRKEMVWTFTTGSGAEAADLTVPWTQNPQAMNGSTAFDGNAFVPQTKSFNFGGLISLISPAPEPLNGVEIHFNEHMDPFTVSLTNIRYSPFDTNIAANLNEIPGVTCGGGLFGSQPCKGIQLQPPIPGIYAIDDTPTNSASATYSKLTYIADNSLKKSLGAQFGVNANAFHIDIVSRKRQGAGPSVNDIAGNPILNNSDNTNGNGVIFSVQ